MARGEIINVLCKMKKQKSCPGKGHRVIESPGVGGSLAQLRNQQKVERCRVPRKTGKNTELLKDS